MLSQLSVQEQAGVNFICGDNEAMRRVIKAVIERQRNSIAFQSRALQALSATHGLLAYEAPVLPLWVERASGGRITDVDGNEYIDCHLAYTATILGHNPPAVVSAVEQAMARGLGGGHSFAEQVELAELLKQMVPGLERVAFFHTGGETINAAVRLSKAVTGKPRVAKFEGCYHGSNEFGLHNSWMIFSGRPPSDPLDAIKPAAATGGVKTAAAAELLVLPYNSPLALELLRRHAGELACVVLDPLPTWMSNWPQDAKRFVAELVAGAEDAGVPVIFDEVVCGFRLARGGAREWSATAPQLSCYGKITSGLGIPLSLLAGDAWLLDAARSNGLFRDYMPAKVWLSSTLAGSFIPVVAALAQLRYLHAHYDALMATIDQRHAELSERLAEFAERSGIPLSLQGHHRLQLQLSVGKQEPAERTYRGMMQCTSPAQFRSLMALTFYLRLNGIYCKLLPTLNLSAAHSEQDIEALANGIEKSLLQMEQDGMLSC